MNRILSLSLAFAVLASLAGAQEQQEQKGPPVVSLAEIVLDQYRVQNVEPLELYKLAGQLVGRSYFVKEHGGAVGALSSLRLLGNTIVLYDTKEQVQRARELLTRLDAPRQDTEPAYETVEYRPHYVSIETAEEAVDSLVNIDQLRERGLVVMNGRREDIDAALATLKRIDVPEKQVLLTCLLIEVGSPQQAPPLPKELADNLQKLLPQTQFTQAGMAMLKTSVGKPRAISVRIDTAVRSYSLAFVSVAFDEGSASLTVANCSLIEDGSDGKPRELFRTDTVLRGNEYTVLAATGMTPRLLVVRVAPQ